MGLVITKPNDDHGSGFYIQYTVPMLGGKVYNKMRIVYNIMRLG